jgi:hypothetical protein
VLLPHPFSSGNMDQFSVIKGGNDHSTMLPVKSHHLSPVLESLPAAVGSTEVLRPSALGRNLGQLSRPGPDRSSVHDGSHRSERHGWSILGGVSLP